MIKKEERTGYLIRLKNIANSLNIRLQQHRSKVFETYDEMVQWLRNDDNLKTLKIGQTLYIKDKYTPNYWFAGDEILPLKTKELDLSELMTTKEVVQHCCSKGFVRVQMIDEDPASLSHGLRYVNWMPVVGSPDYKSRMLLKTDSTQLRTISGDAYPFPTSKTALTINHFPRHRHDLDLQTSHLGGHTHQMNLKVAYQPGYGLDHWNGDKQHTPGESADYLTRYDNDTMMVTEGAGPNGSGGFYQIQRDLIANQETEHRHSLDITTESTGPSNGHDHLLHIPAFQVELWYVSTIRP